MSSVLTKPGSAAGGQTIPVLTLEIVSPVPQGLRGLGPGMHSGVPGQSGTELIRHPLAFPEPLRPPYQAGRRPFIFSRQ